MNIIWSLVFIMITESTIDAVEVNRFQSIFDCFYARESLLNKSGSLNGNFPPGQQAICIKVNL